MSYKIENQPLGFLGAGGGDCPIDKPVTTEAKSVIFDFSNNHGNSTYIGIRSIDFYKDGQLIEMTPDLFTSYQSGSFSANHDAEFAFDTTKSKVGSADGSTSWINSGNTNQRIIIVFNTKIEFDYMLINNSHSSGTGTNVGVRETTITVTDIEYTDTNYNNFIPNGKNVFDGEIPEHVALNQEDSFFISTNLKSYKSVVFDCYNNWGNSRFIGIRSIEFYKNGQLIPMLGVQFDAYATSSFGGNHNPKNAFDTSKSKTGSADAGTQWMSADGSITNQRLIINFFVPLEFDTIVINNSHYSGGTTDAGVANMKIIATEDEYTDTTFEAEVSNGDLLLQETIARHVSSNVADDQFYPVA